MRTDLQAKNQQAINEFFEAFGSDTAKEYSETIIDLILMVSECGQLSAENQQDKLCKLKDLNRLILQLAKFEKVAPYLTTITQEN